MGQTAERNVCKPGRYPWFHLAGTPADIACDTRAYEEAGADHIVYDLRFRYADWLEQIDLLGKEVLPVLRDKASQRKSL